METDSVPLTTTLSAIKSILFKPITLEAGLGLLVLACLLLLSAMISGSEVAFFALSPKDKDDLRQSKSNKAKNVIKLLSTPEKLLATILIGNNFVNIGIVLLSSMITNSLVDFSSAPIIGFLFETILITFLLLLFGEIVPKVYSSQNPKTISLFMADFLDILQKICAPISALLINSTNILAKRLEKYKKNVSVEDLSHALELTDNNEMNADIDILEGIVRFGNKTVVDIMRSRIDVVALDLSSNFAEVLEIINESGYSRIPIYSETSDNIKGILYSKDLLAHISKGDSFRWQTLIRPPFYVPETKKIDNLLEEIQKSKIHIAIVIDEYGGTSGIVTLEDILEEIVGDINDEFDEDESLFTQIDNKTYLFDAKISLYDFYKTIDCEDSVFDMIKGEADTLAGLILEIKSEIPKQNEEVIFQEYIFRIESADNRRIKQVKVTIP